MAICIFTHAAYIIHNITACLRWYPSATQWITNRLNIRKCNQQNNAWWQMIGLIYYIMPLYLWQSHILSICDRGSLTEFDESSVTQRCCNVKEGIFIFFVRHSAINYTWYIGERDLGCRVNTNSVRLHIYLDNTEHSFVLVGFTTVEPMIISGNILQYCIY